MPGLESDLKLQNWLSILTYDVFRYAQKGGAVVIEWSGDGLIVRLPGVKEDTDGLNSKFRRMAETTANGAIAAIEEPATDPAPG